MAATGRCLLILAVVAVALFFFILKDEQSGQKDNSVHKERIRQETEKKTSKPERRVPIRIVRVQWPSEKKKSTPKVLSVSQKKKVKKVKMTEKKMEPRPTAKSDDLETKTDIAGDVVRGKGGGNRAGSFNMVAEFACPLEFYIKEMHIQGAKTIIYERGEGEFYSLAPQGTLSRLLQLPAGYSTVTRRLTDDYPDARKLLNNAESVWGPGRYEILLLVPLDLEKRITEILTQVVQRHSGHKIEEVSNFSVLYKMTRSTLGMLVKEFYTQKGAVKVNELFVI